MKTLCKIIVYILTLCFLGLCVISGALIEQGIKDDNVVPYAIGMAMIIFEIIISILFINAVMKELENE